MLGICLLASALAFVTLQFELVHPSTCPHRLGEEYNSVSLEPAADPDASTYSSHRVRIPPSLSAHNLLLATSLSDALLLSLLYSTKAWLGMAPLHPSASSTHATLDAPRLSLRSTMYKPNHTLCLQRMCQPLTLHMPSTDTALCPGHVSQPSPWCVCSHWEVLSSVSSWMLHVVCPVHCCSHPSHLSTRLHRADTCASPRAPGAQRTALMCVAWPSS